VKSSLPFFTVTRLLLRLSDSLLTFSCHFFSFRSSLNLSSTRCPLNYWHHNLHPGLSIDQTRFIISVHSQGFPELLVFSKGSIGVLLPCYPPSIIDFLWVCVCFFPGLFTNIICITECSDSIASVPLDGTLQYCILFYFLAHKEAALLPGKEQSTKPRHSICRSRTPITPLSYHVVGHPLVETRGAKNNNSLYKYCKI
jgi:hypothetical protein